MGVMMPPRQTEGIYCGQHTRNSISRGPCIVISVLQCDRRSFHFASTQSRSQIRPISVQRMQKSITIIWSRFLAHPRNRLHASLPKFWWKKSRWACNHTIIWLFPGTGIGLASSIRHIESQYVKLKSGSWKPSLVDVTVSVFPWAQPNARCGGYFRDPSPWELYPVQKAHVCIPSTKNTYVHTPKCMRTYTHANIQESFISAWLVFRSINVGTCEKLWQETHCWAEVGVRWNSEKTLVGDIYVDT